VAQPDPVFAAAIAPHQETVRTVDDAYSAVLLAVAEVADTGPMQDALNAEAIAARVMIETAPTTQAGLGALAAHLGDERNRSVRFFIRRPIILADGTAVGSHSNFDLDAVDWLLAKHAAEIAV
jgi:hypothetical protein